MIVAKKIKPSPRGELEITTVNQEYMNNKQLKLSTMGRGFAWLDTGTHTSLMQASNFHLNHLPEMQLLKNILALLSNCITVMII